MKIIKPKFVIESKIDKEDLLKSIETAGRTAYKSEDKITESSSREFIQMIMVCGHLSVIEHGYITVRVICDRGISHEIVRHRLASYTQESTRYCNYTKGKFGSQITVIKPCFWDESDPRYCIWKNAMNQAEVSYKALIEAGATVQEARSVLPNSLKTEIVMTMNLREWRHFFELRTSKFAHPQMREITVPLLEKIKTLVPFVFDDIIHSDERK